MEGDTLVLFEYSSYLGQFDEILMDGSGCVVTGEPVYGAQLLSITIDTIDCAESCGHQLKGDL